MEPSNEWGSIKNHSACCLTSHGLFPSLNKPLLPDDDDLGNFKSEFKSV